MGVEIIVGVENYYNFVWKEVYYGCEVIVYCKGVIFVGVGVFGVIFGLMVDFVFVVCGKGYLESFDFVFYGVGW